MTQEINKAKSDREEWGGWKFVSEMLDNPDKYGIYPTSKCYKQLYDFVVSQKQKAIDENHLELRERIKKMRRIMVNPVPDSDEVIGYNVALSDILKILDN